MYDYKDKYSPQKIGDKIIIPTERYRFWFFGGIALALFLDVLLFFVLISKTDLWWAMFMLPFILVLIAFGGWALEKTKYVITPDYIAIMHGPFGRYIKFNQISLYSSTTGKVLYLYLINGKEEKIEFKYLRYESECYFRDVIKEKNIPEKVYSDCQNFKMYNLDSFFVLPYCVGMQFFLDYALLRADKDFSNMIEVFEVIIFLFMLNLFLLFVESLYAYTVNVHDKCIDVKIFGITIKSFNVYDISDFRSENVTHKNPKGGARIVEELTLNMKNIKLGCLFPTISRQYSGYERFIGYLKANGILTSSEPEQALNELKMGVYKR